MTASRITCGGCDTTWTGLTRAHCGSCHITFNTVNLFDRHRDHTVDPPVCLDPATLNGSDDAPLMRLVEGIWYGREMTEEQREKLRSIRRVPDDDPEVEAKRQEFDRIALEEPPVPIPDANWEPTEEQLHQFEADMERALQGDFRHSIKVYEPEPEKEKDQ